MNILIERGIIDMKQKLTLLLALLLVLSLTGLASLAESEGGLSEPGVLPIWTGDEPYVLTVLIAENAYVSDYDDNVYTKWIEESCNVDLQFVYLPEADTGEKLNIMVNTGEELPDIVVHGLDVATAYSYGEAGAFIDLSEYYERGLAVNVSKAVEEFPDWNLLSNITNYDGSIYAVPKIQASPSNETKYKLWINQTYLDNLGLDMPTTTDEFYEMLVAFRDQDANGNGDPNDELPLLGSSSWGGSPVKFLTNAFVHEGDNDMWMLQDGHVTASYIQDAWFDACDYMKKLCDEGLLLPESFTYGRPDITAVAANENNLVGCLFDSSLGFFGNEGTPEYEARLRYVCCDPLIGPDGVQTVAYAQSTTNCQWFVTSSCEQPELAFRVGDFQFSEEAFLLGRYGVEGENWMYTEDYLKDHDVEVTANYAALGFEPVYLVATTDDGAITEIFGTVQNVNWYDKMPYFSGNVENEIGYISRLEDGTVIDGSVYHTIRQTEGTAVYQKYKPGPDVYCPSLNFTTEELEEIGEIRNTLKTFVNEQRTLYITGMDSMLSDREAFLNELNAIGLERVLEVADEAYQRQYVNN